MKRILIAGAFILVAVPGIAGAAPGDVAAEISSEIMSPFCDGVTLHDCPSQAALDLRQRIEKWARAGWSKERILRRLESEYGPQIRSAPPASGTGVLAWLLPAAAVAAGIGAAWFLARRWTRMRDRAGLPPTPEERGRIEAELAAMRGRS